MSLQVWLPLNGNLDNQGLSDVTPSGLFTSNNNGKIGKCIQTVSNTDIKLYYTPNFNINSISFGGWFKFNKAEIATVVESKTYSSTATYPTGNLIGNDSYGGIGLIWTGNNIYSSGTFSTLSVFGALRTGTVNNNTPSINIDFDKWVHLFLTYDYNARILKLYKDGSLAATQTYTSFSDGASKALILNYASVYGGNGPAANIPFYTNDIRIYDHCLSEKEIKEISKGLVLHYKLEGSCGGSDNLICNSASVTGGGQTSGITSSYEPDGTLKVTAASGNGNYRSCSFNNISQTYTNIENNLPTGTIYTFSFDVKIEEGTGLPTVFITDGNGYASVTGDKNLIGQWQRVYLTRAYSGKGTQYNYISLHLGFSGLVGTWYFKNFKMEVGDKPTPWTPNPADIGDSGLIEYDCSGYGNHGTKSGALSTQTDSPRYLASTKFLANTSKIQLPVINFSGMADSYTFAWWQYNTNSGNMPWGFSNGNRLNFYHCSPICWNTGDGAQNPFVPNIAPSTLQNAWHFIAVTGDGTTNKLYIDGVYKGTSTTYKALTGTQIYISGWDSGTSYTMANSMESDFRIYSTALSEADIKELYETSGAVDNLGNAYAREVVEA